MCDNFDIGVERTRRFLGHNCLGAANMRLAEEELPIEVRQVDCIEIDLLAATHNFDVSNAREHHILEHLTSYASSPNNQYPRVPHAIHLVAEHRARSGVARTHRVGRRGRPTFYVPEINYS